VSNSLSCELIAGWWTSCRDYSGAFVPFYSTAIPLMRPLYRLGQRKSIDSNPVSSSTSSIVDLGTLLSSGGDYEDVFSTDHDTTVMPEVVSPLKSTCQPMSRSEIRRRLEEHQASTTATPEFPRSSTPLDLRSLTPSFEFDPITQYRDVLYSSLSSSPMSRTPALSGPTSSESRSSPFVPQGSNSSSPWAPQKSTFDSLDQSFANLGGATTQQHNTSSGRFDWQLRPTIPLPHPDSQRFPGFTPFYSPQLVVSPTQPGPSNPNAASIDLSAFTQLNPHSYYDETHYRQCFPLPSSSLTSDSATSRPLTRSQTFPHQSRYPSPNPYFVPRSSGPTRDLSVSSWVAQQRSFNPFQVLETGEIPSRYTLPPNPPPSTLPPQYDPSFHQFGTQQHNSGLGMSLPALPQLPHQNYLSQSSYPSRFTHSHSQSQNPFPPPGLPYPTNSSYLNSNPSSTYTHTKQDSLHHLSQRRHELFSSSSSSIPMTRSQSLQPPPPPIQSSRISPNVTLERILNPPYQPPSNSNSNSKDPSILLFPSSTLFMPPPSRALGPIGPPEQLKKREGGGNETKEEEERDKRFGLFVGKGAMGWSH